MSRVVWPKSNVPQRYESQWRGSISGEWWHLSYHRYKWAAILRAAMHIEKGRVIDHG